MIDLAMLAICRNAANCESLGHRPRNRVISNPKALKGRNAFAASFRPCGAFVLSFEGPQGVALGYHIVCLWHGMHCEVGTEAGLEKKQLQLVTHGAIAFVMGLVLIPEQWLRLADSL